MCVGKKKFYKNLIVSQNILNFVKQSGRTDPPKSSDPPRLVLPKIESSLK